MHFGSHFIIQHSYTTVCVANFTGFGQKLVQLLVASYLTAKVFLGFWLANITLGLGLYHYILFWHAFDSASVVYL